MVDSRIFCKMKTALSITRARIRTRLNVVDGLLRSLASSLRTKATKLVLSAQTYLLTTNNGRTMVGLAQNWIIIVVTKQAHAS